MSETPEQGREPLTRALSDAMEAQPGERVSAPAPGSPRGPLGPRTT
jgi:hypothetical protein